MKVKLADFDAAVVKFLGRVIDTLPSTGHKFAAGAMLAGSAKRLEALVAQMAVDGMVDTDAVRTLVRSGFSAAGDRATFTVGSDGLAWLLKPVNVSVTLEDVEQALAELEQAQH